MARLADAGSLGRSDFLSGGGEMGDLIRATDWSRTPLGPIDDWSQSLRTAVSLCLASKLAIDIVWGPQHTQIYNDAFRDLCGAAHPSWLGERYIQTWADTWLAVAEPFQRALAGEGSILERQSLFISRGDRLGAASATVSISPIRDESGEVGGLVLLVVNATGWEGAGAKPADRSDLLETQQRLAFALDAARLGSWEFDIAAGRYTSAAHSRAIFGLGQADPFENAEDVARLVHPEDRARRQVAIDRAISSGEDMDIEYRIVRPDGQIGWVLARGRAAFEDGRAVRLAGISLDITERKAAEEHQRLLLDELNHRVKNTLATVQSIALQTGGPADAKGADDPFFRRLLALSQAHDLLTEASWEGASLADVIQRTLDPHFAAGEDGRTRVEGPPIQLNPNAAVTLHMGFHELATNAMKYGALSAQVGQIDVAWSIDSDSDPEGLEIVWRERGGPPVATPNRRGFGSRMIEHGLAHEFGGECRLAFDPAGLSCYMRLPLTGKLRRAD
jgi:PAS domain S-box-containing protein